MIEGEMDTTRMRPNRRTPFNLNGTTVDDQEWHRKLERVRRWLGEAAADRFVRSSYRKFDRRLARK
jgi:hypothetical protein